MPLAIQGLETWIFRSNAKTKMDFLSGTSSPVFLCCTKGVGVCYVPRKITSKQTFLTTFSYFAGY